MENVKVRIIGNASGYVIGDIVEVPANIAKSYWPKYMEILEKEEKEIKSPKNKMIWKSEKTK